MIKSQRPPKPANRTLVTCTDANTRVKGVVVSKNENQLVVDLPTGFQMTLEKPKGRKLYVYRIGTLEFVSDGWMST
jgi:hypothetical protein